jgi:ABC-2 type transport system ATP-binding protein
MAAAIEAEGLVKTYPGDVRALDGVSFEVEPGTIFGLLGPNGAGKSTTVKILTTLSRPDAGAARVAGCDVLGDPGGVRRAVGVVAQKHACDGEATGRENLLLQGRLYGLRGGDLAGRVDDLLARFGLAEAADRFAKGYSGGMQRRLDVALGLVARPQVLFLDEPTTGLDPEVRVAMWGEIEQLAREEGLTILLTTHYLEEADQLARRIVVIDHGVVIADATPGDVKARVAGKRVTFRVSRPIAGDAFERLPVQSVEIADHRVRLLSNEPETVLRELFARGVAIADLEVVGATLEEALLSLTRRPERAS